MKHKIQIVDLGNGYYSFITDKFSSLNHFILCSHVKSMYKFAWDAYKDAKKMLVKYPFHLNAIKNKKYAVEEYSDMVVTDISADEMLSNHYNELYETFKERAEGLPKDDSEEAEILYGEIKGVVGEILKVKEELEKSSEKSELDHLLHNFSKLTKKYFNSFLLEDAKKEEQGEIDEASEVAPPSPEQAGAQQPGQPVQPGMQPPADGSQPPLMPSALNKDMFIRMASQKITISAQESLEVMEHYCDKICNALKYGDPSIIGNVNASDRIISIKNSSGTILHAHVNKNLMVDCIYPLGITSQVYFSNSLKFYQKFWKPVVEAVGHYYIHNLDGEKYIILSSKLPDITKDLPSKHIIEAWNCTKSVNDNISMLFTPVNGHSVTSTWILKPEPVKKEAQAKTTPSKYTEEDYFQNGNPAMVMCTDPKLKSIFRKIGQVSRVFPSETGVIAEIDFGNNVIVRLREDKFEIIDVNNPPVTEKIQRHKE